jgi:hypothetical protein
MPSVHLRSTYWSHATRCHPARSRTITGRHANQRCQCMADGRGLRGISYPNASAAAGHASGFEMTALRVITASPAVKRCPINERTYSDRARVASVISDSRPRPFALFTWPPCRKGQRHERRYLSTHSIRSIIALNVLPRNESAYDVDARRNRQRRPNRVSAPDAAGLEGPFRPTNGAFSIGALPPEAGTAG